jgi:hypothetical protein
VSHISGFELTAAISLCEHNFRTKDKSKEIGKCVSQSAIKIRMFPSELARFGLIFFLQSFDTLISQSNEFDRKTRRFLFTI